MFAYLHTRKLELACLHAKRSAILICAIQQKAIPMVPKVHKADQGHPARADAGSAPRLLQPDGGHSRLQQGGPYCNYRLVVLCLVSTDCAFLHICHPSNAVLTALSMHNHEHPWARAAAGI